MKVGLTEQFVQAINGGSVETVRELFDSNPQDRERLIEAKDEFGRSVLQLATFRSRWKKNTPDVKLLLENGAEMDLWSACGLGNFAAIDAHLDKNPEALSHTVHDVFPIQYPILTNRPEIVSHLLDHGEDPNRPLKRLTGLFGTSISSKRDFIDGPRSSWLEFGDELRFSMSFLSREPICQLHRL